MLTVVNVRSNRKAFVFDEIHKRLGITGSINIWAYLIFPFRHISSVTPKIKVLWNSDSDLTSVEAINWLAKLMPLKLWWFGTTLWYCYKSDIDLDLDFLPAKGIIQSANNWYVVVLCPFWIYPFIFIYNNTRVIHIYLRVYYGINKV